MLLCTVGILTSWKLRCWLLAVYAVLYIWTHNNKSFEINEMKNAQQKKKIENTNWIKCITKSKPVTENGWKRQRLVTTVQRSSRIFVHKPIKFFATTSESSLPVTNNRVSRASCKLQWNYLYALWPLSEWEKVLFYVGRSRHTRRWIKF